MLYGIDVHFKYFKLRIIEIDNKIINQDVIDGLHLCDEVLDVR